jgi:hypothetical protein
MEIHCTTHTIACLFFISTANQGNSRELAFCGAANNIDLQQQQ